MNLKIIIHRGTKQIGGSCVEVSCGGDRILLDLGLPLPQPGEASTRIDKVSVLELLHDGVLPTIAGVYRDSVPDVKAVILSHVHQDHTGLAGFVHPDIPVLATAGTWALTDSIVPFAPTQQVITNRRTLDKNKPMRLGCISVTAIPVDHSAPDAAALYIEGGGRRLLYTGDLRSHGKKGYLFDQMISRFHGKVDTLLIEGTTVGSPGHACKSESSLEADFLDVFRKQSGLTLIFCSGQNLDRIVVIFRSAKIAGKTMVIDLYTAFVLHKLGALSKRIPQFDWPEIRIIAWPYQEQALRKAGEGEFVAQTRERWTSTRAMKDQGSEHILLMRANRMMNSLESHLGTAARQSHVIWSMWDGYWNDDKYVRPFCERHGISPIRIHTSGHASWTDLQRLIVGINPTAIVPIHTIHAKVFDEHFENVRLPDDGETFLV
jgi:ribonuclease J